MADVLRQYNDHTALIAETLRPEPYLQLMFFLEKASLADPNIATSSAPPSNAPWNPFRFGTRTEKAVFLVLTPTGSTDDSCIVLFHFLIPAITSELSAIVGTHFGLTKLVASTVGQPASASFVIKLILSAVGTNIFSGDIAIVEHYYRIKHS